jgi:hypothetical protein
MSPPTAPTTPARRWPAPLALCGLALLAAWTLRALLVPGAGELPGRDAANNYVWELVTRAALADGHLPYWNPFHLAGTPHLADPATTVLYPPAVLLRWLPPAAFLSWMVALHVWLGGAGALHLGRTLGLGWMAAAAAAVAVMLGGGAAARVHNGHLLLVYGTAWLPWALALAWTSARRTTVWPHPGLVGVMVLQVLAGYLQGSLYLTAAVCAVYLFAVAWPEPERVGSRWRPLGQLGVLGALSAGLSTFLLLPAAGLVAEASRTAGIPYGEAIESGWTWAGLATLVFPFAGVTGPSPHRELADAVAYVGWMLLVLAPLALVDRDRRRVACFLALLVLPALALAITDLPLFRLHHWLFPGLRVPGRALFVATAGLAMLGALGLERAVALARARDWGALGAGLSPGIALLLACSAAVWSGGAASAVPLWPWLPWTCVGGLALTCALASRGRTVAALAAALAVVTLEVGAFARGATAPVPVATAATVRAWLGPPVPGRALSTCESQVGAGELMLNGQPALDGVAGLHLGRYAEWAYVARYGQAPPGDGQFHGIDSDGTLPVRRDLVDAAGMSVRVSCAPLEEPSLTLLSSTDGLFVYRNDAVWPRALWICGDVPRSRASVTSLLVGSRYDAERRLRPEAWINVRWSPSVTAGRRVAIENRHGLDHGVSIGDGTWTYAVRDRTEASLLALVGDPAVEDTHGIDRATGRLVTPPPATAADVEPGNDLVAGAADCDATGSARVVEQDRPDGRVAVDVNASDAGHVFLSEPFYPQRRAFVDGRPVEAVEANLAFTAVPVPAGRHLVELRHVPTAFHRGLWIGVLTMVVWAGARLPRRLDISSNRH